MKLLSKVSYDTKQFLLRGENMKEQTKLLHSMNEIFKTDDAWGTSVTREIIEFVDQKQKDLQEFKTGYEKWSDKNDV